MERGKDVEKGRRRSRSFGVEVARRGKNRIEQSGAFGVQPYFDEPFYVGFNIGGYELGLDPDVSQAKSGAGGTVAYWGVNNLDEGLAHFSKHGAKIVSPAQDVGGGIRVATVADPFGNVIGLIENPHFALP